MRSSRLWLADAWFIQETAKESGASKVKRRNPAHLRQGTRTPYLSTVATQITAALSKRAIKDNDPDNHQQLMKLLEL